MFSTRTVFAGFVLFAATFFATAETVMAETMPLRVRSVEYDQTVVGRPQRIFKDVAWDGSRTAVIVCDAWDYHHCLNAVRRLEEFAPRLDQVLKAARTRGAIVIHAPSDCMPAYVDHPARQRAIQAPKASPLPVNIEHWCSQLPREANSWYPIDQSDGGEDDDPQEHAEWAAKLKAMGRNPGMPWKKQSDLIKIDATKDYISDRGDEVWNILEQHGIQNVILTGVHCNMCVLGRPFGLRQMVRNGKNVVLMRDMTDSMYSPKSWPYVDHFTGHDLVLDHVETYVCSTITSDQFLGGEPFRWKADQRKREMIDKPLQVQTGPDFSKQWRQLRVLSAFPTRVNKHAGPVWYRAALWVPPKWPVDGPVSFELPDRGKYQLWINGHELQPSPPGPNATDEVRFTLPSEHVVVNDYNLVVLKTEQRPDYLQNGWQLQLNTGSRSWIVKQGWQFRIGDDPRFSNIPLPAKFGMGPDAVLRFRDMPDPFETPRGTK